MIAGDQNSDPLDGDSIPGAIQQLIEHPRVNTKVTPDSEGAVEQSALQGGANLTHLSDPRFDTADFADTAPGNLRADYVLPSKNPAHRRCRCPLAALRRPTVPAGRHLPVPELRPPAGLDRRTGARRRTLRVGLGALAQPMHNSDEPDMVPESREPAPANM